MHFLKRTASFIRLRVIGQLAFAHDRFQEALIQNSFRDLCDIAEAEESFGWVAPDNCLQQPQLDQMMIEPYFKLMLRLDRRKVPAALFNAHLAIEEQAALAASGKKKLSLSERRELKYAVKKFLLEKAPATSSLYRALWNFRSGNCFLFSTSRGILNRFTQLFIRTFELELEPVTPWAMAEQWAGAHNALSCLQHLEASSLRNQSGN